MHEIVTIHSLIPSSLHPLQEACEAAHQKEKEEINKKAHRNTSGALSFC